MYLLHYDVLEKKSMASIGEIGLESQETLGESVVAQPLEPIW
jgi:hypothetical protein